MDSQSAGTFKDENAESITTKFTILQSHRQVVGEPRDYLKACTSVSSGEARIACETICHAANMVSPLGMPEPPPKGTTRPPRTSSLQSGQEGGDVIPLMQLRICYGRGSPLACHVLGSPAWNASLETNAWECIRRLCLDRQWRLAIGVLTLKAIEQNGFGGVRGHLIIDQRATWNRAGFQANRRKGHEDQREITSSHYSDPVRIDSRDLLSCLERRRGNGSKCGGELPRSELFSHDASERA